MPPGSGMFIIKAMGMVNGMERRAAGRLMAVGVLSLLFVGCQGCRSAPSEATVEAVLRGHFEARGYRVADLELGGISPVPLSEKTYMGARGYVALVRRITLEASGPAGPAHKAGEPLTFENATVRITEESGPRGGWTVSVVTGIPVP